MPQSAITEIEDIYKFAAGFHFLLFLISVSPFPLSPFPFSRFAFFLFFSFSATLAVRSYVRAAPRSPLAVTLLW